MEMFRVELKKIDIENMVKYRFHLPLDMVLCESDFTQENIVLVFKKRQ